MLGIVYIALCVLSGKVIMERFAPEPVESGVPAFFFIWPAAYFCGTLALTWPLYLIALLVSVSTHARHPLLAANIIVMIVAAALCCIAYYHRIKGRSLKLPSVDQRRFIKYFIPSVILFAFITLMCYRSFSLHGGTLYVGYSVFSDFATHLGMIRSFSYGNNFPTQYSHFAGEDIRYHFMFQFLAGNLEYLGLPIDHAFNIPSILSMAGACSLLFVYASRLIKKAAAGGLSVLFMIFHSSPSLLRALAQLPKGGFVLSDWLSRSAFFSFTDKEDWGLWNYKVYLNQRHLAFGMGVAFLVFILCDRESGESRPMKQQLKQGIFCGVLLGLIAFWNGAMLIGCLSVLFVLALFSKEKLKYALVAAVTLALSCLQSALFVRGSAVSPSIEYGFLAANATPLGTAAYLLALSGALLILAAASFVLDKKMRVHIAAFSLPLVFAFFVSLTPDVTVNHKYVMLAFILLGIPVAKLLCSLWKKSRAAAVLLALFLCSTGAYECLIVYNIDARALEFADDDALTQWVAENSSSQDMWLTDMYSNHESVLGGAMLYYGWPYYAWSAGYDTYGREEIVRNIFSESDPQQMKKMIDTAGIRFILIDDGLRSGSNYEVREDVIAALYPCVFADGDVAVYDTKGEL